MIPTAIGLKSPWPKREPYFEASDWIIDQGLQPYTPQLRYKESGNFGSEWDDVNKVMKWSKAAVNYTSRCSEPMVFSYGGYWYKTNPQVLWWGIDGKQI